MTNEDLLLHKLERAGNWEHLFEVQKYSVVFFPMYSNFVLATGRALSFDEASKLVSNDPLAVLDFYEDVYPRTT